VEGVVEEQGGGAGVAPPPLPDDVERRLRAMPELADGQGAASPTGATPGVQVIVAWLRAQIPAALGGTT
jgi:hypothetical protein